MQFVKIDVGKEEKVGLDDAKGASGMEDSGKIIRVLDLYQRLQNGEIINKSNAAVRYGVNERSIQRDIQDIRTYMEQEVEKSGVTDTVIYDRIEKGYRLEKIYDMKLKNSEVLAICKILLDSRAFRKDEMDEMLRKLLDCCVPKCNQDTVKALIANEQFHYIEPQHKKHFLDNLWTVGQAIKKQQYIEIEYERTKDKKLVKRKLKPVAILFSEFYFYMTAFIDEPEVKKDFDVLEDSFPTIYRIDRIKSIQVLEEHFHVPYKDRFEEGEFRKRVQFMYGGKLEKIKFKYLGTSVEAVLDRLPTAKILDEENGVYTISAEVFGKGIEMWLRSQGDNIRTIE